MAKLIKKWMNMFQMIVIFTLESKIGFINLGFGTYYDHCASLLLAIVMPLEIKHHTAPHLKGLNCGLEP